MNPDKIISDAEDMRTIAEQVFGVERVEVTTDEGKVNILIYFPELTIKNSAGGSLLMRDFFVRVSLFINYGTEGDVYYDDFEISGAKTCFTRSEAQVHYTHSHISPSTSPGTFGLFCLGTTFTRLIENLKNNRKAIAWEMFFHSLAAFVSWESLEGGPYILFSDTLRVNSSESGIQRREYTSGELIDELLRRILPHLPRDVWEFTPEPVIIINHPALIEAIEQHSTIRSSYKDSDEFDTEQLERNVFGSRRGISFRGELIPTRIFKDESKKEKEALVSEEKKAPLDIGLIVNYTQILNTLGKDRVKNFKYEQFIQQHREKFGEISAF